MTAVASSFNVQAIQKLKSDYQDIGLEAHRNLTEGDPKVLRHLNLTFQALDKLFAIKVADDIYGINTNYRADGATTNAEAYLGDAYRNAYLARQYLREDSASVEDALGKLIIRLREDASPEQISSFGNNNDKVWDMHETQNGFSRIGKAPLLERDSGDMSWVDFFNRTIRDQRFEYFKEGWFTAEAMGDYLICNDGPAGIDGLDFRGFIGRTLDLRPLGDFGNEQLIQILDLLKHQYPEMPYLKNIYFTDNNKATLASLNTDGLPQDLIA